MIEDTDRRAYYRAALSALRYVEHRQPTGRRFGPAADARWSSLRGDLGTADRIDLLIRDADAQWAAALGPSTVFAKRAVAEDEAFGADWTLLEPVDAEDLWRESLAQPPPETAHACLDACARAWDLPLAPFEPGPIGARDKLCVAGPSALAATILAFASSTELDWTDQVVVVATPPAHRQLAAVAAAIIKTTKATRILATDAAAPLRGCRLVLSSDAALGDADAAQHFVEASAG